MRTYLEAMGRTFYIAPKPDEQPPTVIAALGPKMLELAANHADGAHTYNVTPEHTAQARGIMGPGKLLCVEQKVVLETDPVRARATGRAMLAQYLGLTNYQENWRRLGFGEADWQGEGSDRLLDAIIAWGDEAAIRARLQQHWDAGADHVCIQSKAPGGGADEALLASLAPGG
jgi:probable F420-dependent oxidoreductase